MVQLCCLYHCLHSYNVYNYVTVHNNVNAYIHIMSTTMLMPTFMLMPTSMLMSTSLLLPATSINACLANNTLYMVDYIVHSIPCITMMYTQYVTFIIRVVIKADPLEMANAITPPSHS